MMKERIMRGTAALVLALAAMWLPVAGSADDGEGRDAKGRKEAVVYERTIHPGLHGITWTDGFDEVKEKLEKGGFLFSGKGKSERGVRMGFTKGSFLGYGCSLEAEWVINRLTTVMITFDAMTVEKGRLVLEEVRTSFVKTYGPPRETDRYLLKSIPPGLVDSVKWVVEKTWPPSVVTVTKYESRGDYHRENRKEQPPGADIHILFRVMEPIGDATL